MTIDYTARHTVVTAKLKEVAEAGIERIGRVTHLCKNAHIILSEDRFRKIAEVTLQCKGESIVASGGRWRPRCGRRWRRWNSRRSAAGSGWRRFGTGWRSRWRRKGRL